MRKCIGIVVALCMVVAFSGAVIAQEVEPTTPEITSAVASPGVLWPPNHKMVTVNISAAVADAADPGVTWRVIEITSNEPVDEPTDTDLEEGEVAEVTTPDYVIVNDTTVQLRAERMGEGTGRIYTIVLEATNIFDNTDTYELTVLVPHDASGMKAYKQELKLQKKLFKQEQKAAKKAAKDILKAQRKAGKDDED